MDSGNKNEKSIEASIKNLKIDYPSKTGEINESGPREGSTSDATSCISSADATASSLKESEIDHEAFNGDQCMYYYGYCYPGYTSPVGDWDDQSYYMPPDTVEIQNSGVQGDNGSLLYYVPGYQAGYSSYNPMITEAVVGVDGQYMGQPSYYPNPMVQQPLGSPGLVPQSLPYGPELIPAYPWDSSLFFANGFQSNGFYGDPTTPSLNSSFTSGNQTHPSKTSTSSKSMSEVKGSSLGLDVKLNGAGPNQPLKPANKGSPSSFSKGYAPNNKFPSYTSQGKSGVMYPNSYTNAKENSRTWVGSDKTKGRNKLHGFDEFDLLSEQNRGPRTNITKNCTVVSVAGSPDDGKIDTNDALLPIVRKDMYNLPDFLTKYDHALFFVIKSYSEDDIHKSIKYNVWASTPNGNRRLDNAFQLAQEKMAEKGIKCPLFLFFSVNASGQFCGVAEMLDHVNFQKSMDFWQQDKWNGFFPVKWHIIKDVPNPQFRHILLENNENKPVTNCRDTQEVKFPQGSEMLNIFKSYSSKTSILDDFEFYESRQKVMQHKRSKLPAPDFDHTLPKTEEPEEVTKPDDLKSVSTIQPYESGAARAKGEQLTVAAGKE